MPDTPSRSALDRLRQFDSCAIANAIEQLNLRLRNEGFTDRRIQCLFPDMRPVVGHAATVVIRCSSPPAVGSRYTDRTDWWTHILTVPPPRIVVAQDVDERAGLGAFVGEVHANVLRALDCVAIVTNGSVRDLSAVRDTGLQAFAAGTSPSHAFVHIVEYGVPVEVAGLAVAPGDLLLGDQHGVVAVPPSIVGDLPAIVADMQAQERQVIELCESGHFSLETLRSVVKGWER